MRDAAAEGGVRLRMRDAGGADRLDLGVMATGVPEMRIDDERGNVRARMKMGIYDLLRRAAVELAMEANGASYVTLRDKL